MIFLSPTWRYLKGSRCQHLKKLTIAELPGKLICCFFPVVHRLSLLLCLKWASIKLNVPCLGDGEGSRGRSGVAVSSVQVRKESVGLEDVTGAMKKGPLGAWVI